MQEAADGNTTTARVKEGLAAYGERGPSQGREVVRKRQRDTHRDSERETHIETARERERERERERMHTHAGERDLALWLLFFMFFPPLEPALCKLG